MKINYVGTFKCDVILDGDMIYHGMNNDYHPLQDYIDKATWLMGEYGFVTAEIVDNETGEIIVQMEGDWQDECVSDDDVLPGDFGTF